MATIRVPLCRDRDIQSRHHHAIIRRRRRRLRRPLLLLLLLLRRPPPPRPHPPHPYAPTITAIGPSPPEYHPLLEPRFFRIFLCSVASAGRGWSIHPYSTGASLDFRRGQHIAAVVWCLFSRPITANQRSKDFLTHDWIKPAGAAERHILKKRQPTIHLSALALGRRIE